MHAVSRIVEQFIVYLPSDDPGVFDWEYPLSISELTCRMFNFLCPLGMDTVTDIVYTAILYLKRASERIPISRTNIIMLFTYSCILADKYINDESIELCVWDRFILVGRPALKLMEVRYCELMRWDFRIHPDDYCTLRKRMEECLLSQEAANTTMSTTTKKNRQMPHSNFSEVEASALPA